MEISIKIEGGAHSCCVVLKVKKRLGRFLKRKKKGGGHKRWYMRVS